MSDPIYTFGKQATRRIIDAVRIVERGGGADPPASASRRMPTPRELWFVAQGEGIDPDGVSRWIYSGKLYANPHAADPISAAVVKARNAYEARNTSTVRAGWTVTPGAFSCGALTGIVAAPRNTAYRVLGRVRIDGEWYYIFEHRNDPIVRGPS